MKVAVAWFSFLRKRQWRRYEATFAKENAKDDLPYVYAAHRTPMLRKLRDLDMELQYNKVTNLRLAAASVDGLIVRPGQTFSFWYKVESRATEEDFSTEWF